MDKAKVIKKINKIGVKDVKIERVCEGAEIGMFVGLTLKNGEQLYFCQYFNLKPEPEAPYVELYKNGDCAEHCQL